MAHFSKVRENSSKVQRAGEPDEIANAIVFLASSKSSFTTGQVLFVDGGKSAT